MFNNINVFDNFLEDPDYISYLARQQKYYSIDGYPEFENDPRDFYFPGFRTLCMDKFNKPLMRFLNDRIINRVLDMGLDLRRVRSYTYNPPNVSAFFAFQTKDDVFEESWFHSDYCLYAAVLYLQKKPAKNSGTILRLPHKDMIIDNVYNRLIFYRADILHSVQGTFGTNIYDARLTYCSFIGDVDISIKHNNLVK